MSNTLSTERLILRPFLEEDAAQAFSWFGDATVMRFTPSGPDLDVEQTATRIARYRRHQAEHGFSKWGILDRATGEMIGDAGLTVMPDYGWIDLGYRFSPPNWGKGFATEVGDAWIRYAFETLQLKRLAAFAHTDNAASLHVLQKLGFVEDRRDVIRGMPSVVLSLESSLI